LNDLKTQAERSKANLNYGGKISAEKKAELRKSLNDLKAQVIRLRNRANAKAGGKVKVKIGAKTNIKISFNSTKNNGGIEVLQWNKNMSCSNEFVTAWNAFNTASVTRSSLQSYAKNCMIAISTVKSQLICASCDNRNSRVFATGIVIHDFDMSDLLESCSKFYTMLSTFHEMNRSLLAYAAKVFSDQSTKTALANITEEMNIDFAACKVVAPTNPTSSKRNLQAITTKAAVKAPAAGNVAIKVETWNWWSNKDNAVPVSYSSDKSSKCLESPGIADIIQKLIMTDDVSSIKVQASRVFSAYEQLFSVAANKSGQKGWHAFKGTENAIQVTYTPKTVDAKPAAEPIVKAGAEAAAKPDVKAGAETASKRRMSYRRMQAVTPAPAKAATVSPKITFSTNGVDLSTNYPVDSNGFTILKKLRGDETQATPETANL